MPGRSALELTTANQTGIFTVDRMTLSQASLRLGRRICGPSSRALPPAFGARRERTPVVLGASSDGSSLLLTLGLMRARLRTSDGHSPPMHHGTREGQQLGLPPSA